MIADYMESGFLENIADMFRHDPGLFPLIGDLICDERSRVRIGTVALVEMLKEGGMDEIVRALPAITKCMSNDNPTVRGDIAYLLGVIGHGECVTYLNRLLEDENELVRQTAEESLEDIRRSLSGRG